ncbi:MAG TPA: flagellar basal body-associated FliL family protein [Kofleriaceae bacterium]|nr:flagellar basal body-associated FliL family protein [Kofleriaceae bacterium]
MSEPEKPAPESKPSAAPAAKTSKVVLLLLVMNLGASGFVVFKTLTAKPAAAAAHKEVVAKPAPPLTAEVTGPTFGLEPFVVNLDEPGQARYLRVNIQLELAKPDAKASVEKSLLLIRDTILSHLSGLKLADCLGAQAKEKLRGDLITKLTTALGEDKVRRMFFQEFVVQ